MTVAELRADIVVLAAAISAGIHGALTPEHFAEGTGAGVGFVAATAMLAAVVVAARFAPEHALVYTIAAAVFAGLLISYALATTTGLPLLHPEPEPVDGLAVATKTVELVGLVAASTLIRRPSLAAPLLQMKGS